MGEARLYNGKLSRKEAAGTDSEQTKRPQGFFSGVILKKVDPKTKETKTLPSFEIPASHREHGYSATAVEARHFAAAFALFRVSSMKNIHMMLPPHYRDLWKIQFAEVKAHDVADGQDWLYDADPFAARDRLEEIRKAKDKRRDDQARQKAKEAETPVAQLSSLGQKLSLESRNLLRGWTKVPKVELGKQRRGEVESLLRRKTVWSSANRHPIGKDHASIVEELSTLGFRKSHVAEALAECRDKEEALEWLLVYVPEDDLPKWCLPEGYAPGISMARGNLKRQACIERLSLAGYSVELCEYMFDEANGSEAQAAAALQEKLLGRWSDSMKRETVHKQEWIQEPNQPLHSRWEEEAQTLQAIFGDRYHSINADQGAIKLEIPALAQETMLRFKIPPNYPWVAPIISIFASNLPSYIRLSLVRRALETAERKYLGEPMIFNMTDWLELNLPSIVENPGRLRDVASAASNMPATTATLAAEPLRIQRKQLPITNQPQRSEEIFQQWAMKQDTSGLQKMMAARENLPAWKLRDKIVSTVNAHQVTIISGETGSGKSTQCVQFILDDMIKNKVGSLANIFCTQPRRISALSLADRVSDERCSTVGDEVGYAIRGESKRKAGATRITFVTTGVLLRRLQTSGGSQDDMVIALSDISHIVIDEIHERSLDADLLLVLLKKLLPRLPQLKVILMSATLDATILEKYFQPMFIGKIEIEGRTHPVQDVYLDAVLKLTGFGSNTSSDQAEIDASSSIGKTLQGLGMGINYDLIVSTVQMIDDELGTTNPGGILIFLPGVAEIDRTVRAVQRLPKMHVLPLHASLLPIEQRRVFPCAPTGFRKVIAATNVAETSITVEDIVAVIDIGRVKETSFDPVTKMVKLEEVWASRSACKQRRGRAGRVQDGKCYKLYTQNAEAKMAERPDAEIRRVPLEQLCLTVKAMGVQDVAQFLASALTPPESLAVDSALALLRRMGAFDGTDITALGRHLCAIPTDLRCGKLMVYGVTFGCFEVCLTMAAILTVRPPFISPQAKRDESKASRSSFALNQGDLLCDARAYGVWAEKKHELHHRELRIWCEDHYLSLQTLNDIHSNRAQYLSSLKESAFVPWHYRPDIESPLNAHNTNDALIRALVAGAFTPQITRIDFPDKKFASSVSGAVELDPEARTIKFSDETSGRVFVHPSSTLFGAQNFVSGTAYLSFFSKTETSKIFIRELTPLNVYSLLMFSGPITLDTYGRGLLVDGWLKLSGWARIGVLVSRLRKMLDEVLAKKIEDPGLDVSGEEVVDIVRKLVELDGMDR